MQLVLKLTLAALLATSTFSVSLANAQAYEQDTATAAVVSQSEIEIEGESKSEYMLRSSCRAREVERYYCPSFGGGQWWGPYYDRGCSVKCAKGQRAICKEASCEDNQSGQPVDSSCTCR